MIQFLTHAVPWYLLLTVIAIFVFAVMFDNAPYDPEDK